MPRNDHFTDISVAGKVSLGAQSTLEGNIIPDGDDSRDLGTATERFRNLYLVNIPNMTEGNFDTIRLGNTTQDVVLTRAAANTLQLASGDDFRPADTTGQSLGDSTHRWDFVLDSGTVGSLNNIHFVDGVKYTTAQAAIDAAKSSPGKGLVIIPPDYAGANYTSTGPNVTVLDLRIRQMVNTGQYGITQFRQVVDSAPTTASGNQTMLNPEMVVTGGTNSNEITAFLPLAYRSAGSAHIWASNPLVRFDNLSGRAIGQEIDVDNNSGVDVTDANDHDFVGQYILSGSVNGPGTALWIAASSNGLPANRWVKGIIVHNWKNSGIEITGPANHILMIPDLDDTGVQISGLSADASTARWWVDNTGNINAPLLTVRQAGAGSSGDISSSSAGDINLLPATGTKVLFGGDLAPTVDATEDLGVASTNRFRDAFLSRDAALRRIKASQGTALVAGDFALSAGWGTTASIGTITGTDQGFRAIVTSAGTGQGANPTITLTFKDGTWTSAPVFVSIRGGGSQATVQFSVTNHSATTLELTFNGTPVDTETYTFSCVGMGR